MGGAGKEYEPVEVASPRMHELGLQVGKWVSYWSRVEKGQSGQTDMEGVASRLNVTLQWSSCSIQLNNQVLM